MEENKKKLTVADFPLLAKLLLVAFDFDKEQANNVLADLVQQASRGNRMLALEDSASLNNALNWMADATRGANFWVDLDDYLESRYEWYSFPHGFHDLKELDYIVARGTNK